MSTNNPVRNILITGSSRGLGLELVSQYVLEPNTYIIATARNLSNAEALQQLKRKHSNLTLIEMDVSSPESIRSALKSLPPLSVLINNAGIMGTADLSSATPSDVSSTFNTNVTGSLVTIQAALPALKQAVAEQHIRPVVVNMTSSMGSIQLMNQGMFKMFKALPYEMSKAAVNMLTAVAAQEHPDITFISLHPGWVDTDLGNSAGVGTPPLSSSQSVTGMRSVIGKIKAQQSGHFISYEGEELPF